MNQKPIEPYVFQPEPASKGERIFGVSGPGADAHQGKLYTKAEATNIVRALIFKDMFSGKSEKLRIVK